MKKEILGNDIFNTEDFNTNYLEQYKKFKSSKIKEELNFDTSVNTVQAEIMEDDKPTRSHFIPPIKKERGKKMLKNFEIDVSGVQEEVKFLKSSKLYEEIMMNLKLYNNSQQDEKNKITFSLPNVLNESFEFTSQNEDGQNKKN